jgi:hypothetical protein
MLPRPSEAAYNAAERPLSTKNQLVLVYRSTIRKRRTSHEESTSTRSFLTRRASASDSIERTNQGKGVTYLKTERFTSTATTMIFFAQAIQRGRGGHTPPSGFIHRWREHARGPGVRIPVVSWRRRKRVATVPGMSYLFGQSDQHLPVVPGSFAG